MENREESKRDRVRRILIAPLLRAGMRKQTKMKQDDYAEMLVRLADKLGHMRDENLRGLVPLITRHARGSDSNQWPDEVSIVSWAYGIQPPPPRDNPYTLSLLRSEAGRRADAMGYLVELYIAARQFGPPFSKVNLGRLAREAEENRREVERVTGAIERGTATLERRQWLDWYLGLQVEAREIMNSKEQGAPA